MRTPALIGLLWVWKMQAKHWTQVCSSESSEQLKLSFSGIDVAWITEGINGSVLETCQEQDMMHHVLSNVRLFATPWTVARQAPLSMRFSRQAYWSLLTVRNTYSSSSRGSSQSRDQTCISCVSWTAGGWILWPLAELKWAWKSALILSALSQKSESVPWAWAQEVSRKSRRGPSVSSLMRRREGTLDNTRTYRAEHEACGLDHLTLNGSITVPSGEFLDFLRPHFILKKKKKKTGLTLLPSPPCILS